MTIRNITTKEIAELGRTYGVRMTGVIGTTWGRIVCLVGFVGAIFALSWLIVGILAGVMLGMDPIDTWAAIVLVAVAGVASTAKWWLVVVPKLVGLITTNYFTGELHVFSWGFGVKYIWERYSTDDYISVQADTLKKTTSFVAKDGVTMVIEWTLQYTPWMALLPLYIRTDTEAVWSGLTEIAEGTLSRIFLGKTVKEAREPTTNDLIRSELTRALEGGTVDGVITKDANGSSIEQRFGLRAELSTLSPPVFNQAYQAAMVASAARKIMQKDAKALARPTKSWTGMSADKALIRVMIMNGDADIKEDVFTLQADGHIASMLQALGPALAAAAPAVARAVTATSGGAATPRRRGRRAPATPPTTPPTTPP